MGGWQQQMREEKREERAQNSGMAKVRPSLPCPGSCSSLTVPLHPVQSRQTVSFQRVFQPCALVVGGAQAGVHSKCAVVTSGVRHVYTSKCWTSMHDGPVGIHETIVIRNMTVNHR